MGELGIQKKGLLLICLLLGCGPDPPLGIGTEESQARGVLPLMTEPLTNLDNGPGAAEGPQSRGASKAGTSKTNGSDGKRRPVTCPPARKPKEIDLVLVMKPLSHGKQAKMGKILKEEKIRLLFMNKGDPNGAQHITAVMRLKRFEKLFKGELEYRVVSAGPDDDPICKPFIKSHWIPFELREFIDEIKVPRLVATPNDASVE
jgi:hypothetical protein